MLYIGIEIMNKLSKVSVFCSNTFEDLSHYQEVGVVRNWNPFKVKGYVTVKQKRVCIENLYVFFIFLRIKYIVRVLHIL